MYIAPVFDMVLLCVVLPCTMCFNQTVGFFLYSNYAFSDLMLLAGCLDVKNPSVDMLVLII